MNRLIALSGALICLAAAGLPQDDTPGVSRADAIAVRHAMKAGREAKTQSYPAAALGKWANALPRMFPSGTGKGETSAITQALPAIWRDRAGFDRAAANYAAATARLAALATANDTAGFTKQLEEVNQACAFCHARFKEGDQGPPGK